VTLKRSVRRQIDAGAHPSGRFATTAPRPTRRCRGSDSTIFGVLAVIALLVQFWSDGASPDGVSPGVIARRHFRYATRTGTWRHVGRRLRWALTPAAGATRLPLSWDVESARRGGMGIRWPERYGRANAAGWIEPIRRGMATHAPLEAVALEQPLGNVVRAQIEAGSRRLDVVIDYDDQLELNPSAEVADLYFKMQYRRGGYGMATVVPGGYVCTHAGLYRHAGRWRELRACRQPECDVLGRFRVQRADPIRADALELLDSQDRFRFFGGGRPVWWGEYMDEMSTARVCLDLPGNGEICYRLVEYLAIGACVIGPELEAELPVPLRSGEHLVRVSRDLTGLADECERLLGDAVLRARLSAAAADYFDRYLALEQLGAYYVHTAWSRLAGE
jgi:hypothetical protein